MNRRSFLSNLGLATLAPAAIGRAITAPTVPVRPDLLFVFTFDAQGRVTSMTCRDGYVVGIDPGRSDGDHFACTTMRRDGSGWRIISTSPQP